jgi:hypothetical protein
MASAAENFRSRCGSSWGAPVCSSQASSVAAPHVGQGTDSICFALRSLIFTTTQYDAHTREKVQYCTFSWEAVPILGLRLPRFDGLGAGFVSLQARTKHGQFAGLTVGRKCTHATFKSVAIFPMLGAKLTRKTPSPFWTRCPSSAQGSVQWRLAPHAICRFCPEDY